MTKFAENHLDFHRVKYYTISQRVYKEIMECYEEPRRTNEETDACAQVQRKRVDILHSELNQILMTNSKSLEVCTDKCKDEEDMECINTCGTEYMQKMIKDYDLALHNYM